MNRKKILGVMGILLLLAIWTTNLVATRYSIINGFSLFDLVALRYGIAGAFLLPSFFRIGPRDLGGLGWRRGITISCLAGAFYMMLCFSALSLAPVSHGGVINPGLVPLVVFLGMVFLGRQSFSLVKVMLLVMIVFGLFLVTSASLTIESNVLLGDALFFVSAISWGLFTLLSKLWEIKPTQTVTIISVLSLTYIPLYLIFFYDGFGTVSLTHFVLQAIFQGFFGTIAAFHLFIYSIRRLGAQKVSLCSAAVPVLGTLSAIPVLGEIPTLSQWIGVLMVTLGTLSMIKMDDEMDFSNQKRMV